MTDETGGRGETVPERLGGWRGVRFRAKRRLGLLGRPMIVAFAGHATREMLWLKGRVLEDEGVIGVRPSGSLLGDLRNTFLRFETDEISGARVSFWGAGAKGEILAAADGYFQLRLERPDLSQALDGWLTIDLALIEAPGYPAGQEAGARGLVRVVGPQARFIVVSDIDDTIMRTGANELLRNWRLAINNAPHAREAFPGVPEFYRALARGLDGAPDANPIFYVSSSPWNLYDLVDGFLAHKAIPKGPIFLRNLSSDGLDWLRGRHAGHKEPAIADLLAAYPEMSFVLVGDSGQHDSEIYARLVERHPGRILSVHIHDVRPKSADRTVEDHLARIAALGVPVTLGATLVGAAARAEAIGLVAAGTSEAVRARVRERAPDASREETAEAL